MRRNNLKSPRRFEQLEDRQMMAADIDLHDGILTIQGTNNQDKIVITTNPQDADEVLVTISNRQTGQVLEDAEYDLEDIDRIDAYGLGGNDEIRNEIYVQARLYGADGDDILVSLGLDDVLDGGANNDTLDGGRGADDLIGGTGNDTYVFWGSNMGNDEVIEAANADVDTLDFSALYGVNIDLSLTTLQTVNVDDAIRVQLSSSTGIENVIGCNNGPGDTIRGNSRNNEIRGLGGDDYLYGAGGADKLFGGSGKDHLYGDAGLDELSGEDGDDYLYGGTERDILRGGNGNDYLFGEAGNDDLYGEAGVDNLDGGADADLLDGGYSPSVGPIVRDQLRGGTGVDTFVRHRKTLQPTLRFEDFLDFNSAVDRVLEVWH
jgi:Ca2+-binding RTX toxin-like protein